MKRAIRSLVLAGITVWLAVSAISAYANGAAAVELFRGEQGPYDVAVRTFDPKPPVGKLHLTVIVLEAANQRLVSGALVTLAGTGPEGSVAGPMEAFNSLATPLYHDVSLPIEIVGEWQIEVMVDSELGEERLTFSLQMYDASVNWGVVITMLVAVLLALPIGASGYRVLQRRARPGRKR